MSPVNTSSASTTHVRVGSDHVPTSARSSGTTSPAPVASASAYVATAHSSSDSHCNRDLFAIAMTLNNVPTPDVPLMEIIYDLFCARGAEAFVALIGSPMPVSRAALHHILVNDFGGRALAIGVKWREEDPLQITGIVTCGPVSLGSHWRLSAVFAATHRVPLTLNVMQLATRLWFATLGRQWPRNLTWRAARGSVEGRRILETLLVFHAKKPGQRRPELWASITASGEEYDLAPVEVRLGAGPFGAELLEDLATWGVGGARWAAEEAPALLASVSALPADWSGYVFYGAELPMSCRGFQHMTPLDRETLLGQPIAEMLNSIAVTQRAAMARLRNLESKNFASGTSAAPTTAAAAADATSDAAWKSLVAVQAVSPPAKPAPTPRLSSTDECEDDASWRSLFSTKSVTPALSPRFHHHDVSVLRH